MNILNTKYFSWYNMMILGSQKIINPPYWIDFTATILSSGEIVYLGGRQSTSSSGNLTFAKMNEIYIFNTQSSSWDIINASGDVPNSRIGHSAVLNSNNDIIIYGGTSSEDWMTPATPDLIILKVDSNPYQWMIPQVNNKPSPRSFHSATIVGKYMIIAFGQLTGTSELTNSLNILNISDNTNYYWTSSYMSFIEQSTDTESTNLNQPFLSAHLATILGGTIGGIVVLIIMIVVTVLLIKTWKENSNMRGRQQLPSSQNS
ncbi:hypothetical protein C1645_786732 [Glomus cerebriforme]|uniref:Galactose oxidase n=1 Tax=Glomus cerebriforme TaxID=658196 RepID=A0A397SL34_9GLOM|nr:hypothetical protein C1645_786732 [Glomus cerebriforme]